MLTWLSRVTIRIYQAVAPTRVRASCRFTPSCSEYALQAIETYGVWHGWTRTIHRLRRCRPPNGGHNPV
ncbi:protein of unknown function DUF37 [Paraburkholderia atlantica]|uniref:Membrane protein insertion efficiency factor YidD n=1 Tax=Paraburkholderia atlantica TaxID=2654982 RepID=D5WMB9_PARAM|nr:protein of unknown function DUF37 [Paraburkholderia atlantica]